MDWQTLGIEIGARYDGTWQHRGNTYHQFTDKVTGSTIMGIDEAHVRQRIEETRKAFKEAESV